MPGTLGDFDSYKAKKEIEDQNKIGIPKPTEEAGQQESLRQEILRDFRVDLSDPKNITLVMEDLRSQGKNEELAKLIKAHTDWIKSKMK